MKSIENIDLFNERSKAFDHKYDYDTPQQILKCESQKIRHFSIKCDDEIQNFSCLVEKALSVLDCIMFYMVTMIKLHGTGILMACHFYFKEFNNGNYRWLFLLNSSANFTKIDQ